MRWWPSCMTSWTPWQDGPQKGGKAVPRPPRARPRRGAKEEAQAGKDAAPEGGTPELADMLSPLERVALSMMLEEEGSYLRKVQAWLDQQGITGELRQPFLEPFLQVQRLGKEELEADPGAAVGGGLRAACCSPCWSATRSTPPLAEDVDPGELEVLRRKDGAFWHFVNQMLSRSAWSGARSGRCAVRCARSWCCQTRCCSR